MHIPVQNYEVDLSLGLRLSTPQINCENKYSKVGPYDTVYHKTQKVTKAEIEKEKLMNNLLLKEKQAVEAIPEGHQQQLVQRYLLLNFIIITSVAELLLWTV